MEINLMLGFFSLNVYRNDHLFAIVFHFRQKNRHRLKNKQIKRFRKADSD